MEHPPESVTLSVVIPVYNEVATLATLIARVQAVPLKKEIILVDDGSTAPSRGGGVRAAKTITW